MNDRRFSGEPGSIVTFNTTMPRRVSRRCGYCALETHWIEYSPATLPPTKCTNCGAPLDLTRGEHAR